jgi:hypothetical protein
MKHKICPGCGMRWPTKKQKCPNCGEKLEKPQTLGSMKGDIQELVNKSIRIRDSKNGFFVCISCGRTLPIEVMQAGHYYAVSGYDGLRFDEDNIHGECINCNMFDPSHSIHYGRNLEKKIGPKRLEALHRRAAEYKKHRRKWRKRELRELWLYYDRIVKEMYDPARD